MKVFLSYSSHDSLLAHRLAEDLRAANVGVWLDKWELEVGEHIVQRIKRGIDDAEYVIVLLTPASVASTWVEREWRRKFQGEADSRRISVIPVRGEFCDVPDFLAQRSQASIAGGSYPLGVAHLLGILRHLSGDDSIRVPATGLPEPDLESRMTPVVTPIALEVSRDLIPLCEPDSRGYSRFVSKLLPAMRDELRMELGIPFPGIGVRGNETDMPPGSALILIDEIPELWLRLRADEVWTAGSVERLAALGIAARARDEAPPGLGHAVISPEDRARAMAAGLATWDAAEYLCLALQEVLRRMAALFVDIDVTVRLVEAVEMLAPGSARRPPKLAWIQLTDVLRRLVDAGISVASMGRILEALSAAVDSESDTAVLAERARHALRSEITAKCLRGRDSLPVLRLATEIETAVAGSILETAAGRYLKMPPALTQGILTSLRTQLESLGSRASGAPIITSSIIRHYIHKLIELEFPGRDVLSDEDLAPGTPLETLGTLCLDRVIATDEGGAPP